MRTSELEETLEHDPATSYWLKNQFQETKKRDPIDALNDAETLVAALKARVDVLSKKEQSGL